MVGVCFYFQVHQPWRLKQYNVFDIGHDHDYFDDVKNKEIALKVGKKCYLPMNRLLLDLIKRHGGKFKVAFSVTGTALDQFEQYAPEVIQSFRELAQTGCVEFLAETYYHSLSVLFSKEEFREQVKLHVRRIKELFGITPKVFRNTELIFNNEIAKTVEDMGYKAILAEGADHILGWRSPNFVYKPHTCENIRLLLKNYKLSDDIAFRFSNKGWEEHPLTCEKYVNWINAVNGGGDVINLFMDYETFGEHQWEDTGIFRFMDKLPEMILEHPDNHFLTPSEAAKLEVRDTLDIHHPLSWADIERDLSAWLGNKIQNDAIHALYDMEQTIKAKKDKELLEAWRKLTTSDHFYYMCTKWFEDGDVHKYFNPYDSPYDSFIAFMNVLKDIRIRCEDTKAKKTTKQRIEKHSK
jgi:alpha-amylase